MVKIKMIKTASGPDGSYTSPYEYTVKDELAKVLVDGGAAKYMKEPTLEPVKPAPEPKAAPKPKAKAAPKPKAKAAPAKFKPGAKVKPVGDE